MVPFIDIHTHSFDASLPDAIQVINYMPKVNDVVAHEYVSMGIHPWDSGDANIESKLQIIESNLLKCRIQFIGECGLDKLRGADANIQEQIFSEQMELAVKYQKPMIIHCVKTWERLIGIKRQVSSSIAIVIHGFKGSSELATQLISEGFYLSVKVEDKISSKFEQTLKVLPIQKLFLETDDSDIGIANVYKNYSDHTEFSVEQVKRHIYNNLKSLFKTP